MNFLGFIYSSKRQERLHRSIYTIMWLTQLDCLMYQLNKLNLKVGQFINVIHCRYINRLPFIKIKLVDI